MRLVIDTDVLYAGLHSATGASRQVLLQLWQPSSHDWLLSVAMILEYEAVLKRSEFLESTGITLAEIDRLLDAVAAQCVLVPIRYQWRPMLADPDDDHVAETVVNGEANAVITFNHKDFKRLEERFNVQILSPKQWLERNRQ